MIPENLDAEAAQTAAPFTMDNAAAAMSKALGGEEPARAPDGKFAPKTPAETAEKAETEPAKVVDLKTGKPAEVAKAEAPAEDDEDLEFELPPEKEGEQAKRLKLSQLYEGYEKASKYETELEQLRTQAKTVPAEYQTQLQETMATRSKYLEGLSVIERMVNPQAPSLDMLNPSHQSYDPDGYYAGMQKFERDKQVLAAIRNDQAKLTKQQEAERETLTKAHVAREMEALHRAWPESKNPETLKKVAETLVKDYGFTNTEIEAIGDHRQLLVIRDALELRALKAKSADAAKVVRAKPKLVKGAARPTTNPNESARSNAMNALRQTGSMDAAAAALKGLI